MYFNEMENVQSSEIQIAVQNGLLRRHYHRVLQFERKVMRLLRRSVSQSARSWVAM